MNVFDAWMLQTLNRGAQQWATFDHIVVWASSHPFVKGCVIAAVLVALWCGSPAAQLQNRRNVVFATLVGALAALFAARVLALALPFRPRPLHNPDVAFTLPKGMDPTALDGWTAFPSDHAVLYFAVAAGVWNASRQAGAGLLAFAAVVICLPRMYLGLHHATDILAGALLGLVIGAAFQHAVVRQRLARVHVPLEARWPYAFYAFGWYFMFELAYMFKQVRWMLKIVLQAVRA